MNTLVAMATRLKCVFRPHQVYVGDLDRATVLMVLINAVVRRCGHDSSELMDLNEAELTISLRLLCVHEGLVENPPENALYFHCLRGLPFSINLESETVLSAMVFDALYYPLTAQSVIRRYRITRWGQRWNRWMEAYGRSLGNGEWGPYIWPL